MSLGRELDGHVSQRKRQPVQYSPIFLRPPSYEITPTRLRPKVYTTAGMIGGQGPSFGIRPFMKTKGGIR
jgi:hypothetical protein